MSDRPVSIDLFQPGSVPPELWHEIATSLNEAALQGAEVVQLHMGAVVQRARLIVFRSVHRGGGGGGSDVAYGWGATLILSTRTEPDVFLETALDHFVKDDEDREPQAAVARWAHDHAVEHFLGVTRVAGWQTQEFALAVLRHAQTSVDSAKLARRIAGSAEQALGRLRAEAGDALAPD